ncbi:MFS transporter [Echinicola jeungdonensis]|nr:MFS transporter [Echinicola jeungdonensis]MDN3670314.1 MFS transporter [Echinicola jeungdonensis]
MAASWNGTIGWRWMFWAEMVPAIAFFVLMFVVPKSPRFLLKIGDLKAASRVLTKVGGEAYALQEVKNIKSTLQENNDRVHFKELNEPKIKPIVFLGVVLAIFQQWCGINVIFNYAEEIFSSAGYSVGDMLFNIVITGSVNLVFTLVAMKTVDKWGRKKLMLFGSGGLSIIYFVLGLSYFQGWTGLPILILVVVSIATYAMSLAPITWWYCLKYFQTG